MMDLYQLLQNNSINGELATKDYPFIEKDEYMFDFDSLSDYFDKLIESRGEDEEFVKRIVYFISVVNDVLYLKFGKTLEPLNYFKNLDIIDSFSSSVFDTEAYFKDKGLLNDTTIPLFDLLKKVIRKDKLGYVSGAVRASKPFVIEKLKAASAGENFEIERNIDEKFIVTFGKVGERSYFVRIISIDGNPLKGISFTIKIGYCNFLLEGAESNCIYKEVILDDVTKDNIEISYYED